MAENKSKHKKSKYLLIRIIFAGVFSFWYVSYKVPTLKQ